MCIVLFLLPFSSFSEVTSSLVDDIQSVSYYSNFEVPAKFTITIVDNTIIVDKTLDYTNQNKKKRFIKIFNLSSGHLITDIEFKSPDIRLIKYSDLDVFLEFSRYHSTLSDIMSKSNDISNPENGIRAITILRKSKKLLETYFKKIQPSNKGN